jgi:hypothetical protein
VHHTWAWHAGSPPLAPQCSGHVSHRECHVLCPAVRRRRTRSCRSQSPARAAASSAEGRPSMQDAALLRAARQQVHILGRHTQQRSRRGTASAPWHGPHARRLPSCAASGCCRVVVTLVEGGCRDVVLVADDVQPSHSTATSNRRLYPCAYPGTASTTQLMCAALRDETVSKGPLIVAG